ncbi:MAG: AAA family ATPase [Bifidobacteriaceae bacterium]|jgi:predicted AAA+ superfamily ATPase|nr:AAA family ATPase [Bifidobacteriaceae bacterium]
MSQRIPRALDQALQGARPGRAVVLYGARRTGKTNLVENALNSSAGRVLRATGDDLRVRNLLQGQDRDAILAWTDGHDTLFLDEAQRVRDVGWGLNTLVDSRPNLLIIATGSASFALAGQIGEPLTGRHRPLTLYPVAVGELANQLNDHELTESLEDFLVHGMYPEVRTAPTDVAKREILRELTGSYLLKDVLELERIQSSQKLADLLTLLALQVGNLVSLNELGRAVQLDAKTVARYLDLLRNAFVLDNLRGFSRNMRNEVTKKSKWYFCDLGVRNAIINNFNPLASRDDAGALWENFMVMERAKAWAYAGEPAPSYFWRSWEGQEIDLVEDRGGKLHAYEFKFGAKSRPKVPAEFARAYPQAVFEVVSPDSFISNLRGIRRA